MTPAQRAHEQEIAKAHIGLSNATRKTDKEAYWAMLVAGIKSRDPEVTEALESERMKRVGL